MTREHTVATICAGQSFCTFLHEGRMGNVCFEMAAAFAYARRHGLRFSIPPERRPEKSAFWAPLYFEHLVHPDFKSEARGLPTIEIKENGFPFQNLEFREEWKENHVLILNGYFQSSKYFDWCFDDLLKVLNFPWKPQPFVSVHVRRSDAKKYPEKHFLLSADYYERQMDKFRGSEFVFFSDEIEWAKEHFGGYGHCYFEPPFDVPELPDNRPEVRDLVAGSWCEHQICSASTFSLWQAILNRNPNKRCIAPKHWLVPGWQSTTAETWRDVVPTGPNWERA